MLSNLLRTSVLVLLMFASITHQDCCPTCTSALKRDQYIQTGESALSPVTIFDEQITGADRIPSGSFCASLQTIGSCCDLDQLKTRAGQMKERIEQQLKKAIEVSKGLLALRDAIKPIAVIAQVPANRQKMKESFKIPAAIVEPKMPKEEVQQESQVTIMTEDQELSTVSTELEVIDKISDKKNKRKAFRKLYRRLAKLVRQLRKTLKGKFSKPFFWRRLLKMFSFHRKNPRPFFIKVFLKSFGKASKNDGVKVRSLPAKPARTEENMKDSLAKVELQQERAEAEAKEVNTEYAAFIKARTVNAKPVPGTKAPTVAELRVEFAAQQTTKDTAKKAEQKTERDALKTSIQTAVQNSDSNFSKLSEEEKTAKLEKLAQIVEDEKLLKEAKKFREEKEAISKKKAFEEENADLIQTQIREKKAATATFMTEQQNIFKTAFVESYSNLCKPYPEYVQMTPQNKNMTMGEFKAYLRTPERNYKIAIARRQRELVDPNFAGLSDQEKNKNIDYALWKQRTAEESQDFRIFFATRLEYDPQWSSLSKENQKGEFVAAKRIADEKVKVVREECYADFLKTCASPQNFMALEGPAQLDISNTFVMMRKNCDKKARIAYQTALKVKAIGEREQEVNEDEIKVEIEQEIARDMQEQENQKEENIKISIYIAEEKKAHPQQTINVQAIDPILQDNADIGSDYASILTQAPPRPSNLDTGVVASIDVNAQIASAIEIQNQREGGSSTTTSPNTGSTNEPKGDRNRRILQDTTLPTGTNTDVSAQSGVSSTSGDISGSSTIFLKADVYAADLTKADGELNIFQPAAGSADIDERMATNPNFESPEQVKEIDIDQWVSVCQKASDEPKDKISARIALAEKFLTGCTDALLPFISDGLCLRCAANANENFDAFTKRYFVKPSTCTTLITQCAPVFRATVNANRLFKTLINFASTMKGSGYNNIGDISLTETEMTAWETCGSDGASCATGNLAESICEQFSFSQLNSDLVPDVATADAVAEIQVELNAKGESSFQQSKRLLRLLAQKYNKKTQIRVLAGDDEQEQDDGAGRMAISESGADMKMYSSGDVNKDNESDATSVKDFAKISEFLAFFTVIMIIFIQ